MAPETRQRYVWDAENRLRAVTPVLPGVGDLRAEFAYDYLGRRTVQTVSSWTGSAWTVVSETKYVWAGWLMLMELDGLSECGTPGAPTECVVRKYTWGLDLAGQAGNVNSLESAGGLGGLLAVSQSRGDTGEYLFTYDANGNVAQVLDRTATTVNVALVAHYEYAPYGNVINDLSGYAYAETNRWRFSTKQFDAATGLGYWGYRYYDPVLGRWLSRDPIEELGGTNIYHYAANSPVLFVDPLGLRLPPPDTSPIDGGPGPGLPSPCPPGYTQVGGDGRTQAKIALGPVDYRWGFSWWTTSGAATLRWVGIGSISCQPGDSAHKDYRTTYTKSLGVNANIGIEIDGLSVGLSTTVTHTVKDATGSVFDVNCGSCEHCILYMYRAVWDVHLTHDHCSPNLPCRTTEEREVRTEAFRSIKCCKKTE